MTEAEVLRTFIRIDSVFKSERLCANIKLTVHNALIRTVMTYVCPAWELAADTYLLKLQHLQNKIFSTTGNFPRCTPVSDSHAAFNDYIRNLCRQQAEITQNQVNEHVRGIGQGEARHRKYKLTTVQVAKLPL
jgi:hypothetical protein